MHWAFDIYARGRQPEYAPLAVLQVHTFTETGTQVEGIPHSQMVQ